MARNIQDRKEAQMSPLNQFFYCDDDECDLPAEIKRLKGLLESNGIPVEDPAPVSTYLCPALAEMLGLPGVYPIPPALKA